ncbi:response regulator, partial [Planctomycetota bacterium]
MSEKKVLIIDDNEQLLLLLKEYLTELGAEPIVTSCAAKGIRLAETEQPDLILLDIMMPDMPGDEVAAELKANAKTSDIP